MLVQLQTKLNKCNSARLPHFKVCVPTQILFQTHQFPYVTVLCLKLQRAGKHPMSLLNSIVFHFWVEKLFTCLWPCIQHISRWFLDGESLCSRERACPSWPKTRESHLLEALNLHVLQNKKASWEKTTAYRHYVNFVKLCARTCCTYLSKTW